MQNRIFREIENNKVLAKSLGSCLNFSRLKHSNLLEKILAQAERNPEFTEGIRMNEDLRNDIKLLNKESQGRITDVCNQLEEKGGYDKNKFSFNDYPITGFPSSTYYYCTNKKNEFDDQNVIDDEMKEYLQMVLDEMKNKNENDKNA